MAQWRIVEVPHGGAEYERLVSLRHAALRAPLGLRFTPEELAAEARDRHFGAYQNEALAGTGMLVPLSAGRAQIRQMAVAPALQGRGVGRALLEYIEACAQAQGVRELVAEAREEALGFYRKLNYRVVGETYLKLGVPHRNIVKELGSA